MNTTGDMPIYAIGRNCPICATTDTVALNQDDTYILWCERGHIVVIDPPNPHKLIFNFDPKSK